MRKIVQIKTSLYGLIPESTRDSIVGVANVVSLNILSSSFGTVPSLRRVTVSRQSWHVRRDSGCQTLEKVLHFVRLRKIKYVDWAKQLILN